MSIKEVVIAIFTIIIDQIIKSIMQIYNVHLILIDNILSIDYCYNQGAAWNILSGHLYLLILITIIMLVVIYSLMFSYKENKLTNLSFGLLFGGVVSNLLDRIIFGYVRDFISLGSFPVFNIADASIVVGVILIIIISLKGDVKNEDKCRGRK